MFNELIFVLQVGAILGALFWAYKLGKEAIVSLSVLLAVLANFFVLKQMSLFGFNVTCSDAYAIGSIFGLNILNQVYGKEIAKKTIWISFFAMTFFAAMSQIHLFFEPSSYDTTQVHFSALLLAAPRLLFASITTFFIVQQIDVRVFGLLQRFPWKIKSILSLLFSQAIDTVLFSLLGLYGVVQELGSIIVVSYIVKCAVIGLTSMVSFKPLKVET
jgi:uncharacterized integral membrane protein (TIGR00697 family)